MTDIANMTRDQYIEYLENENKRLSERLYAEHNHQLKNLKRKISKELYSDYKQIVIRNLQGNTELENCLINNIKDMFNKLNKIGIDFNQE